MTRVSRTGKKYAQGSHMTRGGKSDAQTAATLHSVGVGWCLRGSKCGNPYLKGEVHFALGQHPFCPRCGGSLTYDPRNVR